MKKSLLLTILLLAGISFASGDTLYLKNGLIIEGKISEIDSLKNVVISTPDGREFTYPTSEILRITLSEPNRPEPSPAIGQPDATEVHPVKPEQRPDEERHPLPGKPQPNGKRHLITPQPPHHREPALEPRSQHVAKLGYHGFVSTSSAIFFPQYLQIGLSTTHGAQIHPNLFIGGGFALNFIEGYGQSAFYMPIYTEVRTNLGENLAQFSAGTRLGLTIGNHVGFYWHLDAGLRLGFTPKFALHIAPFIELQPLMCTEYIYNSYNELYSYVYEWKLSCATGIRIGFEF